MSNSTGAGERPARPGETCTCGRAATIVYITTDHGDVPYCGAPHELASAIPTWVDRALSALASRPYNDGPLTRGEEDLLDAVVIMLRGRFGRSSLPDWRDVAAYAVGRAAAAINEEARA